MDDLVRSPTTEDRAYARDAAGTSTGGQFASTNTAPASNTGSIKAAPQRTVASKAKPAPKKAAAKKPIAAVKSTKGPMKLGGDNDPAQVKQLQALLGVLGLGKPPVNGQFDQATEDAVKEAQTRLGLNPTGRASTALVNKMLAAHALSPCIKRSTVDEYDLIRSAAVAGEYDDEDDLDDLTRSQGRLAVVRAGDILRYQRFWPLDDIEISRAHSDGRTVVAYATVFDTPYPVSDQYGEYDETVERSAFNKWIADGNISRAMCLYNHGFTIHGSPSDAYSVPLGQPLEIAPDGRGLKTVTRYNKGPDVDRVLEAISNHAITGQSFRGRIVRSTPNNRRYGVDRDGRRVMVTRHELGLTDYGPTPMPVNAGAEILAVRSLAAQLGMSSDQLAELIRNSPTTPHDEEPEADAATSDLEAGTDEPPAEVARHSIRQSDIARRIAVTRILEGEL